MCPLLIVVICASFLQFHQISCQTRVGRAVPIPLTISNDDPNFEQCPTAHGVYTHTTNCSLFHRCTFGIETIYSCIDGFFFNPTRSQCEYVSITKEMECETILLKMMDKNFFPSIQSLTDDESDYGRKSTTSKCTQTGIYPDILDCSLFHYCHEDQYHEISQCPDGLHFDPKTFLCMAYSLVDCQYEPPTDSQKDIETICADYAPGTYLPLANHPDTFIICENENESKSMKCPPGLIYNALTTGCEKGSCVFDSTLCQNDGQCIDDPTDERGFKCKCSGVFMGEYCEIMMNIEETTEQIDTSATTEKTLDSFTNPNETTHIPYTEQLNLSWKNEPISINEIPDPFFQDGLLPQQVPLSPAHRSSNSEEQEHFEQMTRLILNIILILVGLVLLSSISFGLVKLIHYIQHLSGEPVGEWKVLCEESNV